METFKGNIWELLKFFASVEEENWAHKIHIKKLIPRVSVWFEGQSNVQHNLQEFDYLLLPDQAVTYL